MMNIKQTALRLISKKINVLPAIWADKKPGYFSGSTGIEIAWKKYCQKLYPLKNFHQFNTTEAICVVGGAISGNLEIIDFDLEGYFFESFKKRLLKCCAVTEICSRLDDTLIERTRSGGYHLAYRCETPVDGNQSLAKLKVKVPDEWSAFNDQYDFCGKKLKIVNGCVYPVGIETRAEGGICLIAPSKDYVVIQGSWDDLPIFSKELRRLYLDVARSFNEKKSEPPPPVPIPVQKKERLSTVNYDSSSIAEELRNNQESRKFLEDNGWQYVNEKGDKEFWRRPGATHPISGSLDKTTMGFYSFSTNSAPLESGRFYTPLQLYAAFYYDDDIAAASRDLLRERRGLGGSSSPASLHISFNQDEEEDDAKDNDDNNDNEKELPYQSDFPEELFQIPGMIQDIFEYTKINSFNEQPEIWFAGALAFLSYATARRIMTASGCRPNAYFIVASKAGTGKNSARETNNKLLNIYNGNKSFGAEIYESRQALANDLIARKQILCQLDEFGQYLDAMQGNRCNLNVSMILDEWLKLYSSASNDFYVPRINAASAMSDSVAHCCQPHFTLFATTTPSELFNAISVSSIKKGFIPRCFIIEGRPIYQIEYGKRNTIDVPDSLAQQVVAWNRFDGNNEDQNKAIGINAPFVVQTTNDANRIFADYCEEINQRMNQSEDIEAELDARTFEKTLKIALLLAASEFGPDKTKLIINAEIAQNAMLFSEWSRNKIFEWKQKYLSESIIDKLVKDVKLWISSKKSFTKSDFVRRFQRIAKREREEILDTLLEQKFIECKKEKNSRKLNISFKVL